MKSNSKKKIVAFDLDDVLCRRDKREGGPEKYHSCVPVQPMIDVVNKCYDSGMKVVIYTARGMNIFDGNITKVYSKLYELTKKQVNDWGIKHHTLVMGKQEYDILIDDKAVNSTKIKDLDDVLRWI